VDVMDVSPNNDWTEVRVQVGWNNENFGRPYATHGFILNRPDTGSDTQFANYSPFNGRSAAAWHGGSSRPAIRSVAYRPAASRPAVTAAAGRQATTHVVVNRRPVRDAR